MNIKKELERRINRISLMVEATAIKIVKKELKNFKKSLIKGMMKWKK